MNLTDRIREVLHMVEADAQQKQILLAFDDQAPAVYVEGDPTRLQQVFWNLLNNAIKFTPVGGSIGVMVLPGVDKVRVAVTDTGVGIDPASLAQIFEPFEQGGDRVTRRFGGLGLGLSISRALIDLHNGKVTVSSPGLGRGSTFTVELPQTVSAAPAHAGAPTPSAPSARQGLRILLVEDHVDTARLLGRILKTFGHDVRTANSVKAALDQAGNDAGEIDLVISDVGLPDGTGHQLMEQLLSRYPKIRGVALTGYGSDDDVRRSVDAGFVAHLTKPVDLQELERALGRAVGRN